jgi:(E)-4-hydroxy-3-methylbut-2-enyl-diphosphate synthase
VEKMDRAHRAYPLHLGVTEAGDGEDGRIKSAIGIGSLLLDGLGDTIRVSLTEDSVYEIPVARAIADKAMSLWKGRARPAGAPQTSIAAGPAVPPSPQPDSVDPFAYTRRATTPVTLAPGCIAGGEQPPRVIVRAPTVSALRQTLAELSAPTLKDTPAEGVLVSVAGVPDLAALVDLVATPMSVPFLAVEADPSISAEHLRPLLLMGVHPLLLVRRFTAGEDATLRTLADYVRSSDHTLALAVTPAALRALAPTLREIGEARLLFTLDLADAAPDTHVIGRYRQLVEALRELGSQAPVWIRNTPGSAVRPEASFLSKLLEASFLTGSLLCDGLGDVVSIETEADAPRATKLTYNVLQGAGARISKTEFVACPSCGRTLFDLQTTTQRIRAQTGHLKGVKIAIMGCIVNGPGEMADADFGYVGGAPGKINLYVGKTCVQYNIPQAEADARLIALIREHGKWVDPEPHQLPAR